MRVRLAFSVAAHVQPDVLIVDGGMVDVPGPVNFNFKRIMMFVRCDVLEPGPEVEK